MMKITNPVQMKRLVESMKQNPSFATNFKRGVSKSAEKKAKWESIASTLNSLGPPIRSEKEWRKVWFDAKFKVKQKLLFNKKQSEASGGRSFRHKFLNDLDQAIADVLGLNNVVDPDGNVFGGASSTINTTVSATTAATLSTPTVSFITKDEQNSMTATGIIIAESINEENLTQDEDSRNTTHNQSISNDVPNLNQMLERQTKVQEKLYEEVKKSLNRIENHLKKSARYERKRFYLEEERLKEYKIKMRREERRQIQIQELKLMDLEFKKRQLDIEEKKIKLAEKS